MGDTLLTVEDLADYLKVNPRTVYRMLSRGELPAYRVANQFRFDQETIQRWLAERRVDRKIDAA